jgi:hypothetical protein
MVPQDPSRVPETSPNEQIGNTRPLLHAQRSSQTQNLPQKEQSNLFSKFLDNNNPRLV